MSQQEELGSSPDLDFADKRCQAAQRSPSLPISHSPPLQFVERDNPNLKNKLPRDYARRGIPHERMGGLIDLVSDIGSKGDRGRARDTLGRV